MRFIVKFLTNIFVFSKTKVSTLKREMYKSPCKHFKLVIVFSTTKSYNNPPLYARNFRMFIPYTPTYCWQINFCFAANDTYKSMCLYVPFMCLVLYLEIMAFTL